MISVTNKATGELIELQTDTLEQVMTSWRIAKEYIKVAETIKAQLQEKLAEYVDDNGKSEEYDGHVFKLVSVQRRTYDKAVLMQVIEDQDLLNEMLKPDKKFIDTWLKDNIDTTGEVGTELRQTMVEDGAGFSYYKLEKLTR